MEPNNYTIHLKSEKGVIFNRSGEEKAKEENKRLHFPYTTTENTTVKSTVIGIFNLPEV